MPAVPKQGNGEVVLVAEDEPALREVTRRMLARNGYQVMAVASGADALSALTHRLDHIDVLLTDVIMPQMQGKELAARVLALHPGTRVIYMSGYTQGLLSAQGVLEPGIHLIEKPFSEAILLTKLHEVLAEKTLCMPNGPACFASCPVAVSVPGRPPAGRSGGRAAPPAPRVSSRPPAAPAWRPSPARC
jgi:CheY-like chemotaxis protein